MRIQSHTLTLALALCALLTNLSCAPSGPPKPSSTQAPAAPKAESAPKAASAQAPVAPKAKATQRSAQDKAKALKRRVERPRAATAPRDALHILRTTGSVEGPVPYTIVAPAEGPDDAPILIALHGRGDRAEGFSRLVERLRLPMRVIVGEAPMRFAMGSGKQWFDMKAKERPEQVEERVKDIIKLKDKVAARWPKAPKPLLLGFSQGAMLALQVIAQEPEHFAGAIGLSGALIEPEKLKPSTLARPILMSAGKRDKIIRAEESEKGAKALRALGHQVDLFLFDGGHTVPKDVMRKIRAFLKERHPDAFSGGSKK